MGKLKVGSAAEGIHRQETACGVHQKRGLLSNKVRRMKAKNGKRKAYILLTRLPDYGSKWVGFLTGYAYTHASIGLDEDLNTFYSFTVRGFLAEKITKYVRPGRKPFPCCLYEMEVSKQIYQAIKEKINVFAAGKRNYRYAKLGAVCSLFHIPFIQKQHYFCSQFVAEILGSAKAARLTKSSALYLPRDLAELPNKTMIFQGNLKTFLERFVPRKDFDFQGETVFWKENRVLKKIQDNLVDQLPHPCYTDKRFSGRKNLKEASNH